MDNYSKVILTVIAILLSSITLKLWQPVLPLAPAKEIPTFGDLLKLRELSGDEKTTELDRIKRNIPLSKVFGSVDVDIPDPVNVYGNVNCTKF